MDFAEIRSQYETNKKNLEALLQQLGVNSIETAKLKKEKLDDIHNDISTWNNKSRVYRMGSSMMT